MMLLGTVQVHAQCSSSMSVTQVTANCGADVTYEVSSPVGIQSVTVTVDGEFYSSDALATINLPAGTYIIEALTIDNNNCTMTVQEEVFVDLLPILSASISVQASPCGGQCTGSLMAGAAGGSPPYFFLWSTNPATSDQVIDDLCEGAYIVWVTDMNGCTADALVMLEEAPPTMEFFMDTMACNGNLQLDMSTSGGTGDYSFSWTPAEVMNDPLAEFPTMNVGTDTTVVSVTVTDNVTGCTNTESLVVYPNVPVQSTVELCNGLALLEVNPGSDTYNWSATDVDGNPINMSGVAGNWFHATVAGDYAVVTGYGACNSITHQFEVVECAVECISVINTTTTTTDCSTMFCFTASGSLPIETYAWSFGGVYSSEAPSACFSVATAGFYNVVLNVTYVGGCESTSTVLVQATANGLEVSLPDDDGFIACNGTYDLGPEVEGGSGDFSYLWEPVLAVDNPTGQITGINVNAPQWVYVTVTDNMTGCLAKDSVYVSPNLPVNQTVDLCNGSALLELDPGSATYNWMGTDADGNPIDMSGISGNTFEATVAGDYVVVTGNPGCNPITHVFEVEACGTLSGDVWPGDANSDGEATNTDALWVGLAFDQIGPIRPNATLLWEGQPAPNWNFNFSQNNVNLKHADTDGNGTINFADTIAISQNYGQTHGKTEHALGGYPMLWVAAEPDTVGLSQAVNVTVHLANASMPVDSLHGIAFTLTFEADMVTGSGFSVDFSQNVLGTVGTDVLTLQQPFFADGAIELAISRTTLQNFSGHGPLLTARIVTTDNLSGIHELHFGISGITGITASEAEVLFSAQADTVVIDSEHVGLSEQFAQHVSLYPNPTTGVLQLDGLQGMVTAEVMDATGRVLVSTENNGQGALTINLGHLPDGYYLVRIAGENGSTTKRVGKLSQ